MHPGTPAAPRFGVRARCPGPIRLGLLGIKCAVAFAFLWAGRIQAQLVTPRDNVRGLPISRFYPLDEIADVSQGARLSFDQFGRLAVIQSGAYVVLNDATWLDLEDRQSGDALIVNAAAGPDGRYYYTALGGWGLVEVTPEGKLRAHSLVPPDRPKWTLTNNFTEIISTSTGVYFAGWGGVVYYDVKSHSTLYFSAPEFSKLFHIGDRVFASCHHHDIEYIDIAAQVARPVPGTDLGDMAIDQSANLDREQVVVSSYDGRLFLFDGTKIQPWEIDLGNGLNNRVAALCPLVEGGVAVAINGRGLFLVSPQREILNAMTSPEYHRITSLANREPGVLWIVTEKGVEKILYGSPVTVFGQRLGLPISWPQVVRWQGHVIVASSGRLYQATNGSGPGPSYFHPIPGQPPTPTWGIAANSHHLLIGNSEGVFSLTPAGTFERVIASLDAARLVMVGSDLCYAIGVREIAALRWTGERWTECAPRVPGVGYPAVVHATRKSAWVELGPNRAARIALQADHLDARVFETYPWKDPAWINIGVIGDIVTLAGPPGQRIFYDESREAIRREPELERRLERAPFPISRIEADERGTLWATHEKGVFTITPEGGTDRYDTATFDIIDDRSPIVELLPDGDVWLSSGWGLYHVDRRQGTQLRHAFQPILVSVVDRQRNRELSHGTRSLAELQSIPFGENNLSFRFFAGSYSYRRPPTYQFTLNGRSDWTKLDSGSVLNFSNLQEGAYHLGVTLTDSRGGTGPALAMDFTILPPWYRTWYSFALLGAVAVALFWAVLRWSVHHAQVRNIELEQLVEERTNELKAAMEKLNEETRNAATLAERNRLAGEIHDSVQQGLSGLLLNLESTLKLPGVTGEVRSRLNVARNMLSFTRHEVQNAVWGLESPLLEGTELGEALKRLMSFISTGTAKMEIAVWGAPTPLSSTAKHHFLRMAQEAISNAVRHSGADTITIHLVYEPGAVTLTVADNGHGFEPDEVLANGVHHFGLRGMRARTAEIGAELAIESAPRHGTSIRITLPSNSPTQLAPHDIVRAI